MMFHSDDALVSFLVHGSIYSEIDIPFHNYDGGEVAITTLIGI